MPYGSDAVTLTHTLSPCICQPTTRCQHWRKTSIIAHALLTRDDQLRRAVVSGLYLSLHRHGWELHRPAHEYTLEIERKREHRGVGAPLLSSDVSEAVCRS